jgi:DNA-binding IclR family transcriptional regulator
VGKLLLSFEVSSSAELDEWLDGRPLQRHTDNTITDPGELLADILRSRERGYGIDNQENEIGVNCVALPVRLPGGSIGAVSVSGLTYRRPLESLVEAVPAIREAIARHLP